MKDHFAIKQHIGSGYWFITYWSRNAYMTDDGVSKILNIDKPNYQAKLIRDYKAINQIDDVYFPNVKDAYKALEWVEAVFLAASMGGENASNTD